jgi:hypothetical protein
MALDVSLYGVMLGLLDLLALLAVQWLPTTDNCWLLLFNHSILLDTVGTLIANRCQ